MGSVRRPVTTRSMSAVVRALGVSGAVLASTEAHAQVVAPNPAAASDTAAPVEVHVQGVGVSVARGLGDVRVDRDLLTASPRQQTSELLSAAPGFFVDHEDGEGIGNDVYLRGFDLDHGSGIEMRLGAIPINIPTHIRARVTPT